MLDSELLCGDGNLTKVIPLFIVKSPKKQLREGPIEWIGGTSVRKTILPLTIICGCALSVSADAAKTESLSFKTQTVFQQRGEEAAPERSKF